MVKRYQDDGNAGEETLVEYVTRLILAPIRILTSPALLRTYLQTILLLLASALLFAVATIAYTSLYYSYIPIRGIEVPVYLQYDYANPVGSSPLPPLSSSAKSSSAGAGKSTAGDVVLRASSEKRHPFGIAEVSGLVSRQKYDVDVEILVPRSRRNLDAGVWMVDLQMRGHEAGSQILENELWSEEGPLTIDVARSGNKNTGGEQPRILARSRRPIMLTYRSLVSELAYRLLRLPLYAAGLGRESETLVVRMLESAEFAKGAQNVPSSVKVQIRSSVPLDVYAVTVRIAAKLGGLRYVMYQYRLASFVVGTGVFWGVEMGVLLTSWAVLSLLFSGGASKSSTIKDEREADRRIKHEPGTSTPKTDDDTAASLSDASRTFPTLPSQQGLHYSSSSKGKEDTQRSRLDDVPIKAEADADDEDEDDESADFILEEPLPVGSGLAGGLTDSGIGTSMDSGVDGGSGVSRRRSGKKDGRK